MPDRGELLAIEGLELAELEKHDGKIWFYPNLNAGEFLFLMGRLTDDGSNVEPDSWPELIIKLARDADGKSLFANAHLSKILQWDAAQLVKVINGLTPAIANLGETLKKT